MTFEGFLLFWYVNIVACFLWYVQFITHMHIMYFESQFFAYSGCDLNSTF